ncbi:aminodeoxychorismate synthase component I [bacterium SCSIO 12696]|nr:aminodeoxychorismate synthase component I [bacterium SCSIO 12696]
MCLTVPLPYIADCSHLFRHINAMPGAVWFDSGKPASGYGRYDIISAAPSETLIADQGASQLFIDAQSLLNQLPQIPVKAQSVPFAGGLAGYFGYDLGSSQLSKIPALPQAAQLPQARLGLYHWSLVSDHQQQSTQLTFLDSCSVNVRSQVQQIVQQWLHKPLENASDFKLSGPFQASLTEQQYHRAIKRIHDYIIAGDCYQVNFAQHFSAQFQGDPYTAYQQLRSATPSPFSAYMAWQHQGRQQAILCVSPERLLRVNRSGEVETKPIKGTIRREKCPVADLSNADQLLNSHKDRAENLMIVDLLRNDLGKSCTPGSIQVPKLFALESFANVHHLVSTVSGQLSPEKSALQLLQGCFPGGSITGAPKRRAMEIIHELESCQRSAYCGSIGYISRCGRMDTNIAIRTLVADGNALHCWGGGGIVADSNPHSEYQESMDKIDVLMKSLEGIQPSQ